MFGDSKTLEQEQKHCVQVWLTFIACDSRADNDRKTRASIETELRRYLFFEIKDVHQTFTKEVCPLLRGIKL